MTLAPAVASDIPARARPIYQEPIYTTNIAAYLSLIVSVNCTFGIL